MAGLRVARRHRADLVALTVVRGEPRWARHLPWIDGLAALSAGCAVLAARGWLADLYGVSSRLLATIAVINLAYSALGLALGFARRAWLLALLIAANLTWMVVCVVLALRAPAGATAFAYAQFLGEGAFVAALALCELRFHRAILDS